MHVGFRRNGALKNEGEDIELAVPLPVHRMQSAHLWQITQVPAPAKERLRYKCRQKGPTNGPVMVQQVGVS